MPQFAVYKNRNSATRTRFPLLLDIQSDLLESLATRAVVPLSPVAVGRDKVMKQLTPIVDIDSKKYVMVIPQLAGVSMRELGRSVANLTSERAAIIAALDLLITGI